MANFTDAVFDLDDEALLLGEPDDALSNADLEPPLLTITPTGGVILPDDAITIEASDDRVIAIVTIYSGDRVIYDGDRFTAEYLSSMRTVLPHGVLLTVRRSAGWSAGALAIEAAVLDAGGNLKRVAAIFHTSPLTLPPPPATQELVGELGFGRDLSCVLDLTDNLAEVDPLSHVAIGEATLRRLLTARGSLPDHRDYGLDVRGYCNRGVPFAELRDLAGQVRNEISKDDRIESATVTVTPQAGGRLDFAVRITPAVVGLAPFSLTFAVVSGQLTVEAIGS